MLLDLMLLDRANQMQWHFELQHCLAHTELCVTIFYLKIGNFLTGVQPRIFQDRKEGISRSWSSRTPKIASSLRQEKMPVFSSRHFFRFSKNDRKLQLEYTTILLVMCHCWYCCVKESLHRSQVLNFQDIFIWNMNYSRSFSKNCHIN